MMAPLTVKTAILVLFCTLVWAVETDPRDQEIQKDLEFFQTLEVLESMPILTEFGAVLDQIDAKEKSEAQQ